MNILVGHLREYPTMPVDPHDPSLPLIEALCDNSAPLLPPKHCAFKSCTWTLPLEATADAGKERKRENKVVDHICEAHAESIAPAAQWLPGCFDMRDRFAAAYNEAIGCRVREGAPLASYATDRKCLRKASQPQVQ